MFIATEAHAVGPDHPRVEAARARLYVLMAERNRAWALSLIADFAR